MESLLALIGQAFRNASILADDVVVLAKPALAQMDDIVALAKPAVAQSTGVVIDDAAVGAGMIGESQIAQNREYRVWGKIAAGSMINKTILSGAFLALAAYAPIIPQILLGLGGAYLAYEGAHKVHASLHKSHASAASSADDQESGIAEMIGRWSTRKGPLGALARFIGANDSERAVVADLLTLDTILATEILLVAMGSTPAQSTAQLATTLGVVSFATTALVYVPILGIMRSDNLAGWLETKGQGDSFAAKTGQALRRAIPKLMKGLGVIGTVAMLEVGGGILAHKVPSAIGMVAGEGAGHAAHGLIAAIEHACALVPAVGGFLDGLIVGGLMGGLLVGGAYTAHKAKALWQNRAAAKTAPAALQTAQAPLASYVPPQDSDATAPVIAPAATASAQLQPVETAPTPSGEAQPTRPVAQTKPNGPAA